jgi:glucokinase
LPVEYEPMNSDTIISLDIGGTKILGVVINRSAEIVARQLRPSPKGNEAVKDAVIELVAALLASAAASKLPPSGIAIGAPGFVDARAGCVLAADNLEIENLCLTRPVEARFHLPARLFHDVRSATLGEALFGAGIKWRDFIFVNVGTGVSVGLYLNGRVYPGAADKAGEIGHFAHRPVGPGNPCGLEDRLETLASGPALVRRAARGAPDPCSLIYRLADQDPERITTQIIQEAAFRKDALAVRLIEETADYLGAAIGGMLDLLNPEGLILGGGIAQMGGLFLDPLQRAVARYAIESVPLVLAELGSNAGAIGAAAYYFGQGG